MTNIFIFGIHGKMGSLTHKLALSKKDVCVSGGFSTKSQGDAFTSISEVNTPIDVIIDFSSPSATDKLTELCKKSHCALLVASTGHNKEQLDQINSLSTRHPIMISPNLSIGVNLFFALTEIASRLFSHADTCIIDYHHAQKKDAPSGTAKSIANAIRRGKLNATCNQDALISSNDLQSQITSLSVRGGTVVGKHDVIYSCCGETITLSHNAESREIFAYSAIEIATWLAQKNAGIYEVKDYIRESLRINL